MIGLVVSYAFVGAILGLAQLIEKTNLLGSEGTRKFIHIAVAHWFLLAIVLFDNAWLASVVPASFIVLNYLSFRFNLVSAMERDEKTPENLGTVYYAISLTIVTYFAFTYELYAVGAFAILAMGWGDGLAGAIGKRYGRRKIYQAKTFFGTCTMFLTLLVLAFALIQEAYAYLLIVVAIGTLVELFTPSGFDNLSVPLFLFFSVVMIL